MAVDLFSLRMKFETIGGTQLKTELHGVEQQGVRTAAALNQGTIQMGRAASAALNGTKGFKDLSGAYAQHDTHMRAMGATTAATTATMGARFAALGSSISGGFARARNAIGGFFDSWIGRIVTITALVGAYRSVTAAADQFAKSQLLLDAAARRSGVPLELVQRAAAQVKQEFQIATPTAATLVSRFLQMGKAAGDLNLALPGLKNFLTVGAGMGMSAAETLTAAEAAIRGVDDGTDKLFQMNPSQIWKEYAASIGTTAGKLDAAQQMMAMFWKAQQVAASDPGAWQRFMDSNIGKQALFNARLLDAQAAFGTALAPLRLFAYELGTNLINAMSAAWVGLTKGWGTLKSLFSDALPGIVQLGAGKTLLILAGWANSVTGLFAKVGITLGTGLVASMGEAGARLVQAGVGNIGAFNAQRNAVNQAMAEAGGEGAGVDMSPIVFPDLPAKPGATPSEADQKKELARLLRMIGGGGFADAPNRLAPVGAGSFSGKLKDRIDVSGMLAGKGTPQSETVWDKIAAEAAQRQEQLAQRFRNIGTSLASVLAGSMEAAFASKHPLKAFGKAVLAGLGSIFTEMGQAMILASPLFMALNAAMSNPFTSGPALLAVGVAMVALGATLGGIAKGGSGAGGKGGKGLEDHTTRITLTADGLGGRKAPMREVGPTFEVIGASHPRAQRMFGELKKGAARRNIG
jgi:hypothetical protein